MSTNLRARRHERDMTQVELAGLLGCTQQAIVGWERYGVMPHKPMRRKLEAVFGVPIAELVTETETAAAPELETTAVVTSPATHDDRARTEVRDD